MKKIVLLVLLISICNVAFTFKGTNKSKCLNRHFNTKLEHEVLMTNRIIIKNVRINNSTQTFNFLLDSGSSLSTISPRVATLLNIEATSKDSVSDGIERNQLLFGKADFTLNDIRFCNIKASFDPITMPDTKCNVDGIIGFNLMQLCCWSFDLSKKTIKIADNTDEFGEIDDLYYKQKYKLICGVPFIMCNLNENLYSSDMLFDLGDNGKITIASSINTGQYLKEKLPIVQSKGYAVQRAFSTTIDTSMSFFIAQVDKFYFGKVNRKKTMNSENFISNTSVFIEEVDDFNVIGAEILKEYAIILDGTKRKFYSRITDNNPGYVTIGIGILPTDNNYYVGTVWNNSSAMDEGIKAGDVILNVNDIDIRKSDLSSCELYSMTKTEISKSDSVTIKLLRGDQIIEKILFKRDLFRNIK